MFGQLAFADLFFAVAGMGCHSVDYSFPFWEKKPLWADRGEVSRTFAVVRFRIVLVTRNCWWIGRIHDLASIIFSIFATLLDLHFLMGLQDKHSGGTL